MKNSLRTLLLCVGILATHVPLQANLESPKVPQVSAKELDCLTRNVYHEARNQSLVGQMAVAKVTLNRLKDPAFPDTICEVVYEYKQFSWTLKKQPAKLDKEAWQLAKYASLLVLSGKLPGFEAKYYHTTAIRPNWGKPVYTRIQDHVFFI